MLGMYPFFPYLFFILSFSSLSRSLSVYRRKKNKKLIRAAAGEIWEDKSLLEWDESKFLLLIFQPLYPTRSFTKKKKKKKMISASLLETLETK